MTTKQADSPKINELGYAERSAHDSALSLIDDFIVTYENAVEELKRSRARMVHAIEDSKKHPDQRGHAATPVEVLSWTMGALRTPAGNIRIDMACGVSAQLSTVANMRRKLEKEGAL